MVWRRNPLPYSPYIGIELPELQICFPDPGSRNPPVGTLPARGPGLHHYAAYLSADTHPRMFHCARPGASLPERLGSDADHQAGRAMLHSQTRLGPLPTAGMARTFTLLPLPSYCNWEPLSDQAVSRRIARIPVAAGQHPNFGGGPDRQLAPKPKRDDNLACPHHARRVPPTL